MFVSEINVPVNRIRGAGRTAEGLLAQLGIRTVGELLLHWPRAWEDRTEFQALSLAGTRAKLQLRCTVAGHAWIGARRMRTLKLIIMDENGERAALVCFNRPFLEGQFPVGSRCIVYGAFSHRYGELQASSFEIEHEIDAARKPSILPIYPLTEGLTQNRLRKLIGTALSQYARGIDSEISADIRARHGIPSKQEVLSFMHEPRSMKETEEGKRAVIFEEFFFFEYALAKRSLERRGKLPDFRQKDEAAATTSPPNIELLPLQKSIVGRLPFALTAGQLRAVAEINADMANAAAPMARLLQGDVGSGKTLVSFLAAAGAAQAGRQCALAVPTELLARQHAETAARYLEPAGLRIAFLTGNLKAAGRGLLLRELKEGNVDFIIGTHALFSRDVEYKNLSLAIVDEQHRFGVLQRAALIEKGRQSSPEGKAPHLLMMSATPIPRTLALSVFGDLDISTIRESPPGRKPIKTHLVRKGNEARLYDFLRKELSAGRQAYVVCPLIAEGTGLAVTSAEETYEELRGRVFPGIPIALIHSKVDADEQRKIMEGFKAGEVKVLVATSVIEVGVDVPNATCMVIEHAERFGLATLHQLRGRVGRGDLQSYCFLVYDSRLTEEGKARLMVMKETTDGFRIAEEDLKIRGPGEVAGVQQSGYAAFKYGDPIRDGAILEEARGAAFALAEGEMRV